MERGSNLSLNGWKSNSQLLSYAAGWFRLCVLQPVSVAADFAAMGLNIHNVKSKILKYNIVSRNQIALDNEALEEMALTHLDNISCKQGKSDEDVKAKIDKARPTLPQRKNIWNSIGLSLKTKVRILNTNVETVPLYKVEIWKTTITSTRGHRSIGQRP